MSARAEAPAGTAPAPARRAALDPVTLAKITRLDLRARRVVDGVLSGLHPSRHHGSSVEFAEHKEYSPGDEIRHIDWKLYAKSDRLHVKRFEQETNLRAVLLLDASASMAYGERGLSKWEYARTLAASLAWLLLEQRDAVGIGFFRERLARWVPPRSDRAHLQALLHVLDEEAPSGKGSAAAALEALGERMARRGLVIAITDALEPLPPLALALRRLRHRRHEVVLFQVLDADEVEFPFEELTLFRSLEEPESRVLADPREVRRAYLDALEAHSSGLARECRAHEIDHVRLHTGEPLDRALVRWLGARAGAR